MGELGTEYKFFYLKPEGRRPVCRPRRGCDGNIDTDNTKTGCEDVD
jgi:hypothetical protein